MVSPVNGMVNDIFRKVGETVLPGEPVLEILNKSNLFLKSFFSQDDEESLGIGQKVNIQFQNGEKSYGIIKKIYPSTTSVLTQYQKIFKLDKESLIVEIHKGKNSRKWPDIVGMTAKVRLSRF